MSCNDSTLRLNGIPGSTGREIELQKTIDYIQWRYVGDPTWTNLVPLSSLKGDKGDVGNDGQMGIQGNVGPQGNQGIQGIRGLQGSPGITGSQGVPGVKGERGLKGDTGSQGIQGLRGEIGQSFLPESTGTFIESVITTIEAGSGSSTDSYLYLISTDTRADNTMPAALNGSKAGHLVGWDGSSWTDYGAIVGASGPVGNSGTITIGTVTTGAAGSSVLITNSGSSTASTLNFTIPRGDVGSTGSAGAAGVDGAQLRYGNGVPSNSLGINNDSYIDKLTSDVYKKAGGVYTLQTNFKGDKGDTGEKGDTGLSAGGGNYVDDYGATSSASLVMISTSINPITGLAYGNSSLAISQAQARWDKVTEPYSIDVITINSLPVVGTVCSVVQGANTYNYTVSATGGPSNTTETIRSLTNNIRNYAKTSGNVYLDTSKSSSATSTLTTLTVYSTSTNPVTTLINGSSSGVMTVTRTKTYGAHKITDLSSTSINYAAFQQMMKSSEGGAGYGIMQLGQGKTYLLDRTVELPLGTARDNNLHMIKGNGALVKAAPTTKFRMFVKPIYSEKQSLTVIGNTLKVDDLTVQGITGSKDTNEATQAVGFVPTATLNLQMTNCTFINLDVGLDLQFNLEGSVNNCKFSGCRVYGIRARQGQFLNTTLTTSATNGVDFVKCRFIPATNAEANFYFEASHQCSVRGCTFEGGTARNYIRFDTGGQLLGTNITDGSAYSRGNSTVVKNFEVFNSYSEAFCRDSNLSAYSSGTANGLFPDSYAFDFRGAGCVITICSIQPEKMTKLVKADSSPYSGNLKIKLDNVSYATARPDDPNPQGFLQNIGLTTWRLTDVECPTNSSASPYFDPSVSPGQPNSDTEWINPNRKHIWDISGSGTIPVLSQIASSKFL